MTRCLLQVAIKNREENHVYSSCYDLCWCSPKVKCRNVAESQPKRYNVKVSSDARPNAAGYLLRIYSILFLATIS
ncbi:unnamed protein product [Acanthoscelides obtectus]|uniref:Uncharacterized protein n=1 Tax=Acanthoscelides obtectus TaxID=200917 RepID=A0A9P0PKJ9_ACAOB|nr:unnamed protein product [Acanthoscelides obtectus]CAK1640544.1 hypothetical protein AOBTE_LOCUS11788 [Acanthoscelides obtectus]